VLVGTVLEDSRVIYFLRELELKFSSVNGKKEFISRPVICIMYIFYIGLCERDIFRTSSSLRLTCFSSCFSC
jgi:hypothetical protein